MAKSISHKAGVAAVGLGQVSVVLSVVVRRALWALPGGGSVCLRGWGQQEVGLAGQSPGRK